MRFIALMTTRAPRLSNPLVGSSKKMTFRGKQNVSTKSGDDSQTRLVAPKLFF
jgi:hypothetical protein